MKRRRIIIITGAPATGKTTTAAIIAKESDLEKSVHKKYTPKKYRKDE